jgi:hypothetical protein
MAPPACRSITRGPPPFCHCNGCSHGLVCAAERAVVLAALGETAGLRHRVSLYADDVVIFARQVEAELQVVHGIFDFFGGASELRVNFWKSSVVSIHCSEE